MPQAKNERNERRAILREAIDEHLRRVKSLNGFADDIPVGQLPDFIAVALMSGRPELIPKDRDRIGEGFVLNSEHSIAVVQTLRVMLDTWDAHQQIIKHLVSMIDDARRMADGLAGKMADVEDLANYRNPFGSDSEDDD